ncbi:MAG: S8 family serine peptidase, partial [Candidatus Eisenbacteria bacterium]|nr:S8 family serine peptidase [Candidatus Eisenbacteria bacterium]
MRRNIVSPDNHARRIVFISILLAGFWITTSFGMEPAAGGSNQVLLKAGRLTPVDGDLHAGLDYLRDHADRPSAHLLVQLRTIPDLSMRRRLEIQGIHLQQYIPNRSWLASVPTDINKTVLAAAGVSWLYPLSAEEKIDRRILEGARAPWAVTHDGDLICVVEMYKDIPLERGRALMESQTTLFSARLRSLNAYFAVLHPGQIRALASFDEVQMISLRPPDLEPLNDGVREALGVDPVQEPPYDLDGSGVDILVYDTGLIDTHPDFGDRVVWGELGAVDMHATHMAGTIAGDGTNSGGLLRGMAPAAGLISYIYEACNPYCLYNSPLDIEDNYYDAAWIYGADLANNSIGSHIAQNGYPCEWEGDYELVAWVMDAISCGALGLPFLSVWSVGNERSDGRCGTTYGTVGIPATAKNVIAVGSTMSNDHSMTWFSSWGPVDDGRIRPDICAPGCQVGGDNGVTSTIPGGGYESWCGNSMSPPSVSGILALALQQLRQITGDPEYQPLPSTLKALLINTAQDEGPIGPDFQFG